MECRAAPQRHGRRGGGRSCGKLRSAEWRRRLIRIAFALGRTPRELIQSCTSAELTELFAFDALEPVGEPRADFRAGLIAATLANVNRAADADPYQPQDFMPLAEGPLRPRPRKARLRETVQGLLGRFVGK